MSWEETSQRKHCLLKYEILKSFVAYNRKMLRNVSNHWQTMPHGFLAFGHKVSLLHPKAQLLRQVATSFQTPSVVAWASYQIRKLRVAHAPGMPGTFSPLPRVNDPDMHHGTCVTHVPWCMPGSLTSGFSFEVGGGKNVPGIPGACATRNFTYLARGPWHIYCCPATCPARPLWVISPQHTGISFWTDSNADKAIFKMCSSISSNFMPLFCILTWI